MNVRKASEFTVVTNSGETVLIYGYKRICNEYDPKNGFYEIEDKHEFLEDKFGRSVNCIEKGNYQIIDGTSLIDAVSDDSGVL